ncbi:hydrogenase maturation nickel metallochaperone HypA [Pinisolibacter aquiterrae]|uniref:hydrogenase maturation nickel metallochaperone HypA n=1 Tax=Pinisolibacter aquiterrae TaxID=2815579 RepID=UPI001C3C6E05|nr:hydrogenase maturation nickel metallochaperone HypA [Pinisolibacter aquiterrae]MBV5264558.1 hydrogenase maturation nickel metallochaperone HypA [Pinisolibacter aquiterrae]MCC8233327.1 hydrogenase maturation nickel metallochaperone HypA [Pinisolibacter aquiterrae]
MHELTLCEALLDLLDDEKARRGFRALRRLKLEIGRFGCIDPDALVYAFDVTTRDTWLDGAKIEVDRRPGRARCLDCGADVEVPDRLADCPRCGGRRLMPTGGDQMRLVEMEIVA